MAPAGIVPALDELEDGHACCGLGLELPPVEQLAFEGGKEALAIALSYASPTDPMDGRTPASLHLRPKATEVY